MLTLWPRLERFYFFVLLCLLTVARGWIDTTLLCRPVHIDGTKLFAELRRGEDAAAFINRSRTTLPSAVTWMSHWEQPLEMWATRIVRIRLFKREELRRLLHDVVAPRNRRVVIGEIDGTARCSDRSPDLVEGWVVSSLELLNPLRAEDMALFFSSDRSKASAFSTSVRMWSSLSSSAVDLAAAATAFYGALADDRSSSLCIARPRGSSSDAVGSAPEASLLAAVAEALRTAGFVVAPHTARGSAANESCGDLPIITVNHRGLAAPGVLVLQATKSTTLLPSTPLSPPLASTARASCPSAVVTRERPASTFVVNLARRPDRWSAFVAEASAAGLTPEEYTRFDAVDGKSLNATYPALIKVFATISSSSLWRPNQTHDAVGWLPPYDGHELVRGVLGCALTHIALWRKIAHELTTLTTKDWVIVLEDDATFVPNYRARLEDAMTAARAACCGEHGAAEWDEWDLIWLGMHDDRPLYGDEPFPRGSSSPLLRLSSRPRSWGGGTFAYAIRRRAAAALLDTVNRHGLTFAVDWFMLRQAGSATLTQLKFSPHLVLERRRADSDTSGVAVNAATLPPYLLSHIASLAGTRADGNRRNAIVVIASAHQGSLNAIAPWLRMIGAFGVSEYVLAATDRITQTACATRKLSCAHMPVDAIASALHAAGADVLLSEFDVLWLRDPLTTLLGEIEDEDAFMGSRTTQPTTSAVLQQARSSAVSRQHFRFCRGNETECALLDSRMFAETNALLGTVAAVLSPAQLVSLRVVTASLDPAPALNALISTMGSKLGTMSLGTRDAAATMVAKQHVAKLLTSLHLPWWPRRRAKSTKVEQLQLVDAVGEITLSAINLTIAAPKRWSQVRAEVHFHLELGATLEMKSPGRDVHAAVRRAMRALRLCIRVGSLAFDSRIAGCVDAHESYRTNGLPAIVVSKQQSGDHRVVVHFAAQITHTPYGAGVIHIAAKEQEHGRTLSSSAVPVYVTPRIAVTSRAVERKQRACAHTPSLALHMTSLDFALLAVVNRGGASFSRAALSWWQSGILSRAKERVIFLQQWNGSMLDPRLKMLDPVWNVTVIGEVEQQGLALAMAALVRYATSSHVLWLEEDFMVTQSVTDAVPRLESGLLLVESGCADVLKLRHGASPGLPFVPLMWKGRESLMTSLITPYISRHYVLETTHWLRDPLAVFNRGELSRCGRVYICANSRYAGWSNNPFVAKRAFLIDAVLPVADQDWTRTIEGALNHSPELWDRADIVVARPQSNGGLFTHADSEKPLHLQSPAENPFSDFKASRRMRLWRLGWSPYQRETL